jgi:glycosyltransferase involved in cell wall biosynthesis
VDEGLVLQHGTGFARARLLLRQGQTPLGFVEVPVTDGAVPPDVLARELSGTHSRRTADASGRRPSGRISVVLCTRDRPGPLGDALRSLLAIDDAGFEVVVVDNASATDATDDVVRELSDHRVRTVSEPRPGLARARNRGLREARHDIVAFTDDDVVVDRTWLDGLRRGFGAADRVACVCGMVPSGELRTFTQTYFDQRVTWARSCAPRVYDSAAPPMDQPLFPFQVGQYGTGANFALRRDVAFALGGFDEALGVGSPTRGGEDIDMFVRVLLAGHRLAYEPSAIVWHRHRAEAAALREQIEGYGVGLGAWITKLLLDRRARPMVVRRALRGLLHARRMTRVDLEPGAADTAAEHLAALELRAALTGPYHYVRARRAGAEKAPLSGAAVPSDTFRARAWAPLRSPEDAAEPPDGVPPEREVPVLENRLPDVL